MAESVTEGSLLDLIPAMIYWKDAQLVTVGANRVLLEDHGVQDAEDLQGEGLLHGLTLDYDSRALETGLPVLEREISFCHRTLSLSILPRWNTRGDVTGIVGTCFDITESSSFRERLRRRRDFLAGLVEALPVGFFAKDPSSDFSYRIWNRKMEEIFGHSAHSAVYSRDWKLFGAEAADKIEVHDREVLDSPEKGRIPRIYRLKCPAGQRTVSVVRVPLYDDLLETTLVAGVVDDITRENQLEEQLRQAQKMEAVGRLAGGVAHDFNNLLQVIMGAAEMGSLAPDDSREYFDQVLLAGEKAMSLTRQLLSFSRTEGFSRKPFEVDARVGDFTAMVHRIVEASISLEFIPGAGGAVVNGDPFQLEQVLMNLIVNARDALEGMEGGRITVSTSVSEAVCSAGTESVSCAEISVSDNGPGVPEDVQNMIFEPFFTTKAQGRGTGLGLASSYAIVVKHGGTIVLESSPGEGSTFRVFLPIWEGQAGEDENGIPHRKVLPAESGLTILLAEDEEMVREIVKAMLERAGHRVLEASNGRRALEVFRANHESIDLAVFDAMMPEMNGRDAYDEILKTSPDLPCIFCTGYSGESILGHFQGRARVRVLQKPCSASELLAAAGDLAGKN